MKTFFPLAGRWTLAAAALVSVVVLLLLGGAPRVWAAGSVVVAPPSQLAGAAQPQVATNGAGHVFVVVGTPAGTIHCVRSTDGGITFAPPVQVANAPGLALGMRRGPRIVAHGATLTVSVIRGGDLLAYRSADEGQTWSAATRVNDRPDSAREGLQSLAGDPASENLFVTWLDLRSGKTEIYGAGSRDGGATWAQNRLVYASPDGNTCECCHASAAFGPGGELAVLWRNWLNGSRDLYAAISRDGGKTFGPAAKQGRGTWKLSGCPMDGGSIAPLERAARSGGFASVWRREKSVYLSTAAGEETLLGPGAQPVVALGKAGLTVVWQQDGSLFYTTTLPQLAPPKLLAANAAYPAITTATDGRITVAWEAVSPTDGTKSIQIQSFP